MMNNFKPASAKTFRQPERAPVYIARVILYLALSVLLFAAAALVLFINLKILEAQGGEMQPAPLPLMEFSAAAVSPDVNIDASEYTIPEKEYIYEFVSDLSEYEPYMNPEDRDAYMILINYSHTLSEDYKPDDLVQIPTRAGRDVQTMRETPAKALNALLTEAKANGITDVTITSGWRGYNTQVWLLSQQVAKYKGSPYFMGEDDAYALAITEVAIPGTSEHQSGLCVDMHNLPGADISFANSPSAVWLAENCYKFGFVLRFPEDKTAITKISFEPWHFRFVGRYHASRMYELGMCLEEYTDYLEQYN